MRRACFILLVPLLLTACAPQPRRTALEPAPAVTEEAETAAVPSREPVYIYGNKNLPARLTLSFSGEPFLLPSGYARLAGVVSGQRLAACVEIGGRGLALEEGEDVDDYRVVRIQGDHVVLEKHSK